MIPEPLGRPVFGTLGIIDFGYLEVPAGSSLREGRSLVTCGTLNETVYYDKEAGTLRQVGTIPLIVGDPFTINETRIINGESIPAALTITQHFADNILSFDTGWQPLTFDSPTHATVPQSSTDPLPTINASWSLATGGHIYTGNFNWESLGSPGSPQQTGSASFRFPFTDLAFSQDLSEIAFTGTSNAIAPYTSPATGQRIFTAANGVQIALRGGHNDTTLRFNMSVGPTIASAVPEGSPGLLMCAAVLGALALFGSFRQLRHA
jgi:hypothetical protein